MFLCPTITLLIISYFGQLEGVSAACTRVANWKKLKKKLNKFTKNNNTKTLTLCAFSITKKKSAAPIKLAGRTNIIIQCEDGKVCEIKGGGSYLSIRQSKLELKGFKFKDSTKSALIVAGAKKEIKLSDVSFEGCSSANGGALYVKKKSAVYVTDCVFTGCSAKGGRGGAIYNLGDVYLESSKLISCDASDKGGGIYSKMGWLELESSTFSMNTAGIVGNHVWSSDNGSIKDISGNTACSDDTSTCQGYILGTHENTCQFFSKTGPNVDISCSFIGAPSQSPNFTNKPSDTPPTESPTLTNIPSSTPGSIFVPGPDSSWSLLAWGWNNGGKDDKTGTLIVDVDHENSRTYITSLKAEDHKVLCYFSAGTLEKWREDYKPNKNDWDSLIVKKMGNWDEWWLDYTGNSLVTLKTLMKARIKNMKEKGCDGIEPDNIDCYDNSNCVNGRNKHDLKEGQVAYNLWLAEEAHNQGMFIALKNALDIIPELVDHYDCAMNEQCYKYKECGKYEPFFNAGKLVMNVEYEKKSTDWCKNRDFSSRMQSKWCDGNTNGLCKKKVNGKFWVNCFVSSLV